MLCQTRKLLCIIFMAFIVHKTCAQEKSDMQKIDSTVIEFLISQNQFLGQLRDKANEHNPHRFEDLKGYFYKYKLFNNSYKYKTIKCYQFGVGGSHNDRYLLFIINNRIYKIFGGANSLDYNMSELSNFFKKYGMHIGIKTKMYCYRLLIDNYTPVEEFSIEPKEDSR